MDGPESAAGDGGDGGIGGLKENWDDEDGDDVDDFDHGIDGRASGVFVGIPDRISGDGSGVGGGTFAPIISLFDIFFGIIPSAAGGGHGDGDKKTRDDRADENPAEDNGSEARNRGDADDEDDGEKGGDDHLAKGSFGDDIDAGSVVGFIVAEENAGFGGELATNLAHDGTCGHADGIHRTGGENKGEEAANEEADDDLGFGERELQARHGGSESGEVDLKLLHVGSEKDEGGKTGGGDGVSFGDGFHGIANGIELIGSFPN